MLHTKLISFFRQYSISADNIVTSSVPNMIFQKGNATEFILQHSYKWSHKTALVRLIRSYECKGYGLSKIALRKILMNNRNHILKIKYRNRSLIGIRQERENDSLRDNKTLAWPFILINYYYCVTFSHIYLLHLTNYLPRVSITLLRHLILSEILLMSVFWLLTYCVCLILTYC